MRIDLTGKRALITGGTRGIGRTISLTLAEAGAQIAAISRTDKDAAMQLVKDIQIKTGRVNTITCQVDISEETGTDGAVEALVGAMEGLDILVLDAAVILAKPLLETTTEEWMQTFDVNVHGAYFVLKAALPKMSPGGSVVLISSGAGHDPLEGMAAYGASKAAINQLAAILAQEVGPRGIRVNVVSPGSTDKSGSDPNADPMFWTAHQRAAVEQTALRRIGTAQDVANAVLFFASDLSSFVTGQWLRVNGGRV